MAKIFLTVKCPVCGKFVANYSFSIHEVGKTHEYRCPNCRTPFKRKIPKKSNYNPEQLG